jgi:hypothetical protein
MLLDDIVPTYDARSHHAIWVAASPAQVYDVARHADLGGPLLVRALMGLRAVPAALVFLATGRGNASWTHERPVGRLPFTLVDETPGEEFVLGIMGRFWRPTGGLVPTNPEQFRNPPPAGLAMGVWNFRVTASDGGTVLSTETRVRCSEAGTRRRFMRYWRIIRWGSGLIRRSMLESIRREAEKDAA